VSIPRTAERGVALLLVLWIFMILGVIAMDFARYMRDDAMASVNFAEETRGYYVALAGMNRAIFDMQRTSPEAKAAGGEAEQERADEEGPIVPPDGEWHEGDFAGGRWSVRMVDEASRISLNRAPEPLIRAVVTNLVRGGNATTGVDRRTADTAATITDSILDWRDPDNMVRPHGAESGFYLKRRQPYRAKNGFFDSPEELLLVRGVTPALFYGGEGMPGLRDIFSVYTRRENGGVLNVRTVAAPVLQVLLGIDPDEAADLVVQRGQGEPFLPIVQAKLTAVVPHPEFVGDFNPRVVSIEARADVSAQRNQSRVAAVADLASDVAEGARVLRWLDRAPWSEPPPGLGAGAERTS